MIRIKYAYINDLELAEEQRRGEMIKVHYFSNPINENDKKNDNEHLFL